MPQRSKGASMKLLGLRNLLKYASFATFALSLGAGEPTSTDRHVHGVITAVEPTILTIASSQRSVVGKIDPVRTKVTLHGKPAKLSDLQVTAHAKAELCLDDVWIAIDAH